MTFFDVVLLSLYFYVLRFKFFISFNCYIAMYDFFFLIFELLYCYALNFKCFMSINLTQNKILINYIYIYLFIYITLESGEMEICV